MGNLNYSIIQQLNAVLKNELTSINQYFLHARMFKHRGLMKLADYEYRQSISTMKHSDLLVDRVLALDGLPNLQDLGSLRIGESVEEMLACDFALQEMALAQLESAFAVCESAQDKASGEILRKIIDNAQEHLKFIRTQRNHINNMGIDAYLAQIDNDVNINLCKPAA